MGGKHVLNALTVTLALTALAQADPTSTTGQALDPQGTALPADPTIEKATQSIREGRIDEAVVLIREAAGKHPDWPPLKLILARMHFAANQGPQGRRALEQAAIEAPDDPRVYLTFSTLALTDGRLSDGRLNAEKTLSLLESNRLAATAAREARREARALLVSVSEARNDWALADTQLRASLADDPANGLIRQRLGRALFHLGKVDDALKEITQAVKDEPKLDSPGVSMALLFGQRGDTAKAEEWFDRAEKAEPKNARARLSHARWRVDQGRASDALPLVDQAAKLDPAAKEIEFLRGLIAWHLRDLPTAERIFETIHHNTPADASASDLLARVLVEQDDWTKRSRGLQLAEATARQSPKSGDAIATLGWAHYRSGHLNEASQLLRAAVSGGQASADTAYFLARVMADQGQTDAAQKLLVSVTSVAGGFAFKADAKQLLTALQAKGNVKPGQPTPSPSGRPKP